MKAISTYRRHPMAAVVVVLLGLMMCGFAYAAFTAQGTAQASDATDDMIAKGRELYLVGCASCHGMGANGTADAPTLIGVGAAAVDFQVSTGRMPLANEGAQAPEKPPVYTPEEIAALAAYIASLAPGPVIPDDSQLDYSDADLAKGGSLFRTNCSACHNFAGGGGALTNGKFAPKVAGVEPRIIWEAMDTGPQSMPVFGSGTMSDDDKRAIIGFLQQIHQEPDRGGIGIGRLGPVSEGLYGWLVGIGSLAVVAIWIGAKSR